MSEEAITPRDLFAAFAMLSLMEQKIDPSKVTPQEIRRFIVDGAFIWADMMMEARGKP